MLRLLHSLARKTAFPSLRKNFAKIVKLREAVRVVRGMKIGNQKRKADNLITEEIYHV